MTITVNTQYMPESTDDEVLARWVVHMRAGGLAERTITDRIQAVRRLLAVSGRTLRTLDSDAIRQRLALLDNASSRFSVAGKIRACTAWMKAEGIREDDPGADVRPKRPRGAPRPAPATAVRAVLTVADPALPTMMALAALAGLRCHEIAKVRGRDFDLHAGTLRVVGKGGHAAVLPLHPRLAEIAKEMPRDGWWFPSPVRTGRPVSRHWVLSRFRRAALAAGVRLTCHQLRHLYGTLLLQEGADLRTVQTLMRHAELSTTALYTAIPDESRRAAVLRLPDLGGAA